MHDFLVKKLSNTNIEQELINIGFDKTYTHTAKDKFEYINFKIFNLTPAQANIIKQTAISVGADCGTHREVITGKIENSNCILGGSLSQIKKISEKLQRQPFGLKILGQILEEKTKIKLPEKTQLMGVLNVTTNSFSDGGDFYDFDKSIEHLKQLIDDGADIIDIGAESTKPYSKPVSSNDQLKKLEPILNYIKTQNIITPISIDTRSSVVAKRCIELGADIINDVSGFDFDNNMVNVLAQNPNTKIVIQHSQGSPEIMQNNPTYSNLMDEIYTKLKNKVDFAINNGIKFENIIIDPGIGFGKTKEDNFEILRRWKELKTIGCPVLIGISRKSLLDMPQATNEEKDIYTLALDSILMNENIDIIRVHNVKMHKKISSILN
ncbi:MAG: dihydropteroate synthase [Cyanobacteriota bacterium]|nr:dihydropteroate synthase [Cyanobacteriota bacterium]